MKQNLKQWAKNLLLCALIATGYAAQAQDFTITGNVTNLSGAPLSGASIYTFDSTALTSPNPVYYTATTDAAGNYTQIVPNGAQIGPNIIYNVGLIDCAGGFSIQTVANQQGTVNSGVLNFSICDSISIIINPICSAVFYNTPDTLPNTLTFISHNMGGPGTGSSATYMWNFGDGNTSTQATPTHTYAVGNQTYNVCLTVIDSSNNCTDTYCDAFVYVDSTYWYNCDASFASFPSWFGQPNSVDFWATGNGSPFNINTYTWDFGDGTTFVGAQPPTHTYPAAGTYYACLNVANAATNCNTTFCDSVFVGFVVNPVNCSAGFWAVPDSATAAGTINYNFYDASWFFSPSVSYLWDFGDGNTSTLQNPVHTYNSLTATYNACLTITDSITNCNNTYCQQISMPNSPCGNVFISYTATVANTLNFTSNVVPAVGIGYFWDFGDGNTSTQATPTHTYSTTPGGWMSYFVTLTITDNISNCTATTNSSVFFSPPCNSTYIIQNMINPSTIGFSSNSAGALGYSFVWDFGDGTTSTQASPTHTYANINNFYLVQLTYTDSINNCTNITTAGVFPQGGFGCQANFVASPAGLTTTFIDNSFTSSGIQAQYYLWDFGDGNVSNQNGSVTHTYAQAGTYNVCLSIADSMMACTNTLCGAVVVNTTGGGGGGGFAIGIVLADSLPVLNATVYLIEQSPAGTMNVVDTMNTDAQGLYYFIPQLNSTYYIKAAPQASSPAFATHLPTYFGDVLTWQSATPYVANGTVLIAYINLVPVALRPGTAQVMGSVANGGYMPAGSNMAGLSVVMMNDNGSTLTGCTHTLTQANGTYTLPTVDYGSYKVMIEIPGMATAKHSVVLSPSAPMANNVNFVATTNSIALAYDEQTALSNSLNIFPNPNNGNFILNLTLSQGENNAELRILDALGRVAMVQNVSLSAGENAVNIRATNLNEGVYFVSVRTAQAQAHIRFVKTK